jgi:hypothetical protein
MSYFDNYNIRDFKSSVVLRREYFSTFKYNVQIDPQDLILFGQMHNNQRIGLEPVNKK